MFKKLSIGAGVPRAMCLPGYALAAILLTACSLTPPADLTVTLADSGKAVTLNRGQTLVVALDSNPTTGYGWEVASGTGDILTQQGEPVYRQSGGSGRVGAGGVQTFRFRAAMSGQTTLELFYRRSWETGVPPIQTFTLPVTVP